jgi:tetratricopeptide (TPR) repeat protein
MAAAWAARWHSLYVGQGWSPDAPADCARAMELAGRAMELDSQNALALATYGHLQSYLLHDYDSALVYFDRALAACPNHSFAWFYSSPTLSYIGRGEQAVKHMEQALRLSPLDRNLYTYYSGCRRARIPITRPICDIWRQRSRRSIGSMKPAMLPPRWCRAIRNSGFPSFRVLCSRFAIATSARVSWNI